jgi:hypothetical protein
MFTEVWAVLFRLYNVEHGYEFQNVLVGRVREVRFGGLYMDSQTSRKRSQTVFSQIGGSLEHLEW